MPLVGVIDPSHKEKARDTMGRLPSWLSLDDALKASEDLKWSPYTPTLLNAMFSEFQERDYISTTALIAHCPRAEVLKRKLDYVMDLDDMYVPFRGTMVHRTMEMYSHADAIAEHRFFVTIDGVEVSCSPDLLTARTLTDYKVTDNPPKYNYPYSSHKEQLEVNAFIVRNAERVAYNGHDVEFEALPFDPRKNPPQQLAIVYMSPKAPKVLTVEHTEQVFNARTGKFKKAKVPELWSDEKVRAFIEPRLEVLQRALDAPFVEAKGKPLDLAWPEGAEDIWGGEAGWHCPGPPLCLLPNCLAKRYPNRLVWEVT